MCWGYNNGGQLGNGTSVDSDVPVAVVGLDGVQALGAGYTSACALVNGGVQCWGGDNAGQLGDNANLNSTVPVAVQGLGSPGSGVQAIAVGYQHACAIVSGGVQCWGWNSVGQLGNNSTTDSSVPVAVQGLGAGSGVQAIAAGCQHTCALVNGAVQCWGWNSAGQLGNNSGADSAVPVPVSGLGSPGSGVQAIGAGYGHTCALVNGGVQCWGYNDDGQLGNGSTTQSLLPVPVVGLGSAGSGVQAISLGYEHSCALVGGAAQCWGDDANGDLGNNATIESNVPVQVQGLASGVQAIAAGQYHTCALVNGAVQCWGDNSNGDLGNNSAVESDVPVAVQGLSGGLQGLTTGYYHSCAIVNGGVQCWGDDYYGQLGDNSTTDSPLPVAVQGLGAGSGVEAVVAGDYFTCALVGGGVQCWGDNLSGDLGNNSTTESNVPVPVQGLGSPDSGVQALAAGPDHACALVSGGVLCWGDNANGELGNNSTTQSNVPIPVQGLGSTGSGVQAIAAGAFHTCALVNGAVQCWGGSGAGQLGDNSLTESDVPALVQGLGALGSGVQAIGAGALVSCAVANGAAQCWGYDVDGELGNGVTGVDSSVPVPVTGLTGGAQMVVGGEYHTCSLVNGGVECWGGNQYGQLGNNSTAFAAVPGTVVGLAGGALSIAAAGFHSCALLSTGGVECWGDNVDGDLGDGSDAGSSVPVSVGPWAP